MLAYLYQSIQTKGQSLWEVYHLLRFHLKQSHWFLIVFVVGLTPVNWACESRKWQLLAQKIENISFGQAFQGVLSGLALGFLMPNNVGDAAGRVLSLQSHQRLSGVGAALLSNGLQFFVSLGFGTLGWGFWLVHQPSLQHWPQALLVVLLVATIVFGLFLMTKREVSELFLRRFRVFRWIEPYVKVIATYSMGEIGGAFRWAVLRYGVFTLQFALLLALFQVKLPWEVALAGIFLVFFAKTLIPALNFLGDLGIREASSLYVFGFYGVEPARILAVTLTLWCINILLPVLIGTVWTLKLKWWNN